jgi:hypothetical protein
MLFDFDVSLFCLLPNSVIWFRYLTSCRQIHEHRSWLQLCTDFRVAKNLDRIFSILIALWFRVGSHTQDWNGTIPRPCLRTALQVISVGHSAIHQQSNPVCGNWRSIDGLCSVCGPSWPVPRSVGFFWLPGGLPGCVSFWHTELRAE